MKKQELNLVYACIANHKKATKSGIRHATNLSAETVDQALTTLIEAGRIKENKSYVEDGYKINIPVFMPTKLYTQPNLLFNEQEAQP